MRTMHDGLAIGWAVLREGFTFTQPRRLGRTLLYLALVAVPSVLFARTHFDPVPTVGPLLHERFSLEIAITHVLCDKRSSFVPSLPVSRILAEDVTARRTPLRDVATSSFGSVLAYCSATRATIIHENSLMLLNRFWMRLKPNLSLGELARLHLWLKLAGFFAFMFVLFESGASLALSAGGTLCFLGLLRNLESTSYAQYSFLVTALLLAIAVYAWAVRHIAPRRWLAQMIVAVCTGWYTGFGSNLRTSYLPIYLVLFVLYLLAVFRKPRTTSPDERRGWTPAGMTAAFLGAYALFGAVVIRPLADSETVNSPRYTHHVIGHQLVLSLALPKNALSQREGIEWNDMVGERLAWRVDPSVTYMGPGYDQALLRYYVRLWRSDPAGMARVYWAKFNFAGKHMVRYASVKLTAWQPLFVALFFPVSGIPSGGFLLIGYCLAACGAGLAFRHRGTQFSFIVLLLSVVTVMLHCESVIILPHFNVAYHGFLLFSATFLILMAYQGLLQAVGRAVRRWRLARAKPTDCDGPRQAAPSA